jgi:hypothetical protein
MFDDKVMDLAKTYICWYYINANTIVVVETIIGDFLTMGNGHMQHGAYR